MRIVGMLLADASLDLRDRVAGCLLLIFARPLTRITKLTVDDIADHDRPVRVRLGRDPLELPEPLGGLAVELKHMRLGLATTAATTAGGGCSSACGSTPRSILSTFADGCDDWESRPDPLARPR